VTAEAAGKYVRSFDVEALIREHCKPLCQGMLDAVHEIGDAVRTVLWFVTVLNMGWVRQIKSARSGYESFTEITDTLDKAFHEQNKEFERTAFNELGEQLQKAINHMRRAFLTIYAHTCGLPMSWNCTFPPSPERRARWHAWFAILTAFADVGRTHPGDAQNWGDYVLSCSRLLRLDFQTHVSRDMGAFEIAFVSFDGQGAHTRASLRVTNVAVFCSGVLGGPVRALAAVPVARAPAGPVCAAAGHEAAGWVEGVAVRVRGEHGEEQLRAAVRRAIVVCAPHQDVQAGHFQHVRARRAAPPPPHLCGSQSLLFFVSLC